MRVVLVAGTEKGAFVCTSDGARGSWRVDGPRFKGWQVTASARTPGGKYLAATASQVYGAALHESVDLKTWRQIERGPAYPEGGDRKLNKIWTLKAGPRRHYAGVDVAGLFTSDDDGKSWQPVPGLNDHPTRAAWCPGNGGLCAHVVLTDDKRADRVWCGISAVGVWRTDDGGKTWHAKNDGVRCVLEDKKHKEIGFCVHGLAHHAAEADTIFRQDHTGMYRTRDGGDTWTACMNGLPSWFGFPVAVDPRTKAVFCFPMESDEYRIPTEGRFRLFRSRNGGDSWEACSRGLSEQPSYAGVLRGAIGVDGLDPCGVYVGSTAGTLHASADGGESWRALPCTLPRILSVQAYVEE
ncbi:MAG: WD40/YVTN/BNR-like repeat-containing protein [Planctomycetota bacterium]